MRAAAPWFSEVLTGELVFRDGLAPFPGGPGLGVAVELDEALRHPPAAEDDSDARLSDGAVADW